MTTNPRPITIVRAERVDSMSEESVQYACLPEDLEPISAQVNDRVELRIGRNALAFSPKAYAAIGEPVRVEILFGRVSRMLALRPTEHGGMTVNHNGKNRRQIQAARLITKLNLPPIRRGTTLRLDAQLVEGALLVGPLPEATS